MFYTGSSAIFIMWGVLVACGYGLTELAPHSAGIIWLLISSLGCAATVVIVAVRMHARPSEARDWRLIWAMIAMTAFGAAWSFVLGPVVPRQMMYAFQPSLFLLGLMLVGLWLGRFFVILGLVGIVLIVIGYLQAEPWLRLWMVAVQSGTLILGGVWLGRSGMPQ
jgi:hypothetical protein